MSFGSVSINTILSRIPGGDPLRYHGVHRRGRLSEDLYPFSDNIITQVATGLFGVREDTIQRVRMVEFKYAQGAKPGLGGHLLGDKVTPAVARMRESVPGSALFSPFPFHSVYSVKTTRSTSTGSRKSTPRPWCRLRSPPPPTWTWWRWAATMPGPRGPVGRQLRRHRGGPGHCQEKYRHAGGVRHPQGAPFLKAEGIRDQVTLVASGGVRNAFDLAKAIALGADAVQIGTADLVPWNACVATTASPAAAAPGIATTDPELVDLMTIEWGIKRISNLYYSWSWILKEILRRLGLRSIRELVGRTDVLAHLDYFDRPVDDDLRRSA